VKTRLSKSEAEAEKLSLLQRVGTFIVIGYPSTTVSDSDNLVFTRS